MDESATLKLFGPSLNDDATEFGTPNPAVPDLGLSDEIELFPTDTYHFLQE